MSAVATVDRRRYTSGTAAAVFALSFDVLAVEELRELALMISAGEQAFTEKDRIRAIWSWCGRRVTYLADPPGTEIIMHPLSLAKRAISEPWRAVGDCDDSTALLLALLHSIGVRVSVLMTDERWKPGELVDFHHIHGEAWDGSEWIPCDAAFADQVPFGERVDGFSVRLLPEDLPEELIGGRFGEDGLGVVASLITSGSALVRQVLEGRVRSKIQRVTRQVQIQKQNVEERINQARGDLARERQAFANEARARKKQREEQEQELARLERFDKAVLSVGGLLFTLGLGKLALDFFSRE